MSDREERFTSFLKTITGPDEAARRLAEERQAALAKPPGSLGKLEEISIRLAGITGKVKNSLKKKRIIALCADNGVVEEGVSSSPVYQRSLIDSRARRPPSGAGSRPSRPISAL